MKEEIEFLESEGFDLVLRYGDIGYLKKWLREKIREDREEVRKEMFYWLLGYYAEKFSDLASSKLAFEEFEKERASND